MKPFVSITIATFNVAEYVAASLESLLNQTYKHTELICIDDASTDGTLDILNGYAKKDARIKVIAKDKNEGLAVARNLSLAIATGEYILFMDGDDLYDLELIEKAVKLAETESSDVVVWDYCTFYDESLLNTLRSKPSDLMGFDVTNKRALLKRPAFTWVKLFRTNFLTELGAEFPKGLTRQDIPVHWHVFTSNAKVSILAERLSYYRQQPNATTAQKGRKLLDIAQVMQEVKKVLDKECLYEQYQNTYLEQQLNMLHGMYDNVKQELKPEALALIQAQIGEEQMTYIRSHKQMRSQARWFYKSNEGKTLATVQYMFWIIVRKIYRKVGAWRKD